MIVANRTEHAPARPMGPVGRYVLRDAPGPVRGGPEASKGLRRG